MNDDGLDRLLAYHRRRYWLCNGWSIWFRVWSAPPTEGKPHGVKYSLSLHDIGGTRIFAYDNAHSIPKRTEHDHWHRFRNIKRKVPYEFVDGDTLIADFFSDVRRACSFESVRFEIDYEDLIEAHEEAEDDEANAG